MSTILAKVVERLKLSEEMSRKLRTTSEIAEADTEEKIMAVLAGIKEGEQFSVRAKQFLQKPVEYPQRVDECPICYAHMHPVTLASDRAAYFCPVHNVCMPAQ